MTRQVRNGNVQKLSGKLKEAVGIVTGNAALEREGASERARGTIRVSLGKTRRGAGELVAKIATAIKG